MRERLDIEIIKREAQRVLTVEAAWAASEPEDRVAFRAEWHNQMDIFRHLVVAYTDGRLPDQDMQDLRTIAAILDSATPTLKRLRLRQPDPQILVRLRLAAAG